PLLSGAGRGGARAARPDPQGRGLREEIMNVMQPIDRDLPDDKTRIRGAVHEKEKHESGHKHVTGTAEYIDDIPEPAGLLHAYLGLAQRAHADILSIDFSAVEASPGVIGILTASDIPGENDISPA